MFLPQALPHRPVYRNQTIHRPFFCYRMTFSIRDA